jgi:uncharacterized protein (UPF0332 family)
MKTNLERFKHDLERLINEGELLLQSMKALFMPEKYRKQIKKVLKDENKINEFLKKLPSFINNYQSWYSEALVLLKQLLPDRVSDFVRLYEKPKNRKDVTYENYVIEDALQGLGRKNKTGEIILGPANAIPKFVQQLNIVKSVSRRFESSLFDIRQLVQADLFDSELDAARELNKKGFTRGAGAIAGVVLERHLKQVCKNHNITITKRNPTINDLNQLLKDNNIIEVPDWRFIQRLSDLRNLCDHDKEKEPTRGEVEELINGVEKIIKTVF